MASTFLSRMTIIITSGVGISATSERNEQQLQLQQHQLQWAAVATTMAGIIYAMSLEGRGVTDRTDPAIFYQRGCGRFDGDGVLGVGIGGCVRVFRWRQDTATARPHTHTHGVATSAWTVNGSDFRY
jgi:hypothetical protein